MQLLAYFESLDAVTARLQLTPLIDLFGPVLTVSENRELGDDVKEAFSAIAFEINTGIAGIRAHPDQRLVLERLPVFGSLKPNALAKFVTYVRTAPHTAHLRASTELLHLYWAARSILEVKAHVRGLVVLPKFEAALEDEGILQLELIDFDNNGVPVSRLEEVLGSLGRLHRAVCEVTGEEGELRVAYGDSGSDLGLGIIGKRLGIAAIQSLFRDGWQHIRFWREIGFDRRLESLGRGLSFVADVRMRSDTGQIAPETATRIEQATLREMEKLMGSGVAPRHEERTEPLARRELVSGARDVRLLSRGTTDEPRSEPT